MSHRDQQMESNAQSVIKAWAILSFNTLQFINSGSNYQSKRRNKSKTSASNVEYFRCLWDTRDVGDNDSRSIAANRLWAIRKWRVFCVALRTRWWDGDLVAFRADSACWNDHSWNCLCARSNPFVYLNQIDEFLRRTLASGLWGLVPVPLCEPEKQQAPRRNSRCLRGLDDVKAPVIVVADVDVISEVPSVISWWRDVQPIIDTWIRQSKPQVTANSGIWPLPMSLYAIVCPTDKGIESWGILCRYPSGTVSIPASTIKIGTLTSPRSIVVAKVNFILCLGM